MIIQNYKELATNFRKKRALDILEEGLQAAKPEKFLKKIVKPNKIVIGKKSLKLSKFENVYLVSFGKAADSMASTINSLLRIKRGIIVIPQGTKSQIKHKKFQIFSAGHPIPNNASLKAAKTIMQFLHKRKKGEFVIFLVSGGGSSLLSLPSKITFNEKTQVTKQLLKSGATIHEFNCVRKHLSLIKGGMMIANLACDCIALVMSDVGNNDLSSISSGCTYYDKTTFKDAQKVIKKYNLKKKVPKNVLKRLHEGSIGMINETPKKSRIKNQIIATNKDCLKEMVKKAKQLGYNPKIVNISGDVNAAAKKLVKLIPKRKNSCIILGGETTVRVTGKGKGGRNQELVLRIFKNIQKTKQDLVISTLGTDGIDGNTKHAGAIIENFSLSNNKINNYLKQNDSNSFFKKYGGLIKTGPTHTNLMDIGIILN
jgi:hydroxypyruvate reductase